MALTYWIRHKQGIERECRSASFYRDLFAEFLATFILMTVQCSLPADWGKDNVGTVVQVSLGMSFVVGATAWTLGDFGGAHMNPAVTLSMLLSGRITVLRAALYAASQCSGSIAAASFIDYVHPENYTGTLAATLLHPQVTAWKGVLIETWLTFVLVLTILGATDRVRKAHVYMPTLIIAMAVGIGVSCGYNSTGGSMNPARSLGPAVVKALWADHWVYWVGPLTGSALATFVYHVMLDRVDNPGRRRTREGNYGKEEKKGDNDADIQRLTSL
ncbi:hypothetical protein LSH36_17g03077 [Paralvinella palmiformis]|uniref:Uncharacterized protein n=1 Tax=Paralvinella palmiformis TaxID=53620 RepID=A0AAD9KC29_9ANNE|nr:hypothetical protein LSH36_17g03077 [Paralvinella palmiformis]